MVTRMRSSWKTVKAIPNKVGQFVAGAISRIFGLNDDNYPATGVQPFEGEPAKEKHF